MQKKNSDNSITIKDIASLCGVSISTVSNVLNSKTNKVSKEVADKIMEVVEQTGYKPNYLAKNLRATSTKTLGVIVEDLIVFSEPPIIEGIMQRSEELGYSVVIENARLFGRWSDAWMHDEALLQSALEPVLNKMEALNVDGIVYIGGYEHQVHLKKKFEDIPIVFVYASCDDKSVPTFRLDDEGGAYKAYKYLHSMGHSKIAIITGEAESPHTINRLRGIQKAMFEEGEFFNPSMVQYQTFNRDGGYNGMKALEGADITAVMCMSDMIATGVYAYMLEHDMKPGEDLSVIGYDNHMLAEHLSPTLTTVTLALEQMGYEAASWIINKNEGNDTEAETEVVDMRISGELIVRNSVKKIN